MHDYAVLETLIVAFTTELKNKGIDLQAECKKRVDCSKMSHKEWLVAQFFTGIDLIKEYKLFESQGKVVDIFIAICINPQSSIMTPEVDLIQ